MITTCHKCHQEYDDVYRSTQCPHEEFAMHCGVFVDGKSGCAHTVEELEAAAKGVLPNPSCSYQQTFNNLSKAITESRRLKTLSNEDLVRECIRTQEADCLVVEEMCNRLFPSWDNEKGGSS